MNNQEFEEMLDKLYNLGLASGDLGYAYWYKVIQDLKEIKRNSDDWLSGLG